MGRVSIKTQITGKSIGKIDNQMGSDIISQTRWKHIVFFATVIEIKMTAILSNADSDVREPVDPCNNNLTILFSQIK